MSNSPFDDADLASTGTAPVFPTVSPSVAPEGSATGDARIGDGRNLDSILRIPVLIQVVLGSATMPVANLMKLGRGAIVPLDHRVGEPVDVTVNGRVVARGEIVVVEEDNSRFGVSLTEIVGPADAGQNG
ncbi:flagellar motor switch protein FliN [Methylobacterium sp. Leaf465]|uniref:flagellar motor switch protein FliN n=1 Tax=unclassified Methylobacterium TaxID=2615210 RepID=UPI0006F81F6A|nr:MULTISPECIES: flagellar motor switch protein FliN [unclassified Methylobacterium]KQT82040.1 flagellar motor switch protein FliN [Methylobacterium sp. Leaf465]KQU30202.1 flagellar motor switch protein FliN [Methylobacterium sp. Leaf94]